MNFVRAHNAYLDPPDEPEAVMCDDCGKEMEIRQGDMKCTNQYCPSKHEGVAAEMAELLIGAREEVKRLAAKVKLLTR